MGMRGRHAVGQFNRWRPPGELTPKPISPKRLGFLKRCASTSANLAHGAVDGGNGIANWLAVSDYLREWLSTKTRHGDRPSFSKRPLTDFLYWNGRRPGNLDLNTNGSARYWLPGTRPAAIRRTGVRFDP
jgi:hypothetical protein